MAEYIERTEELMLAMNAGARAIENTRRYHGAVYTKDLFSEDSQEIPYLLAAKVLREVSDIPAVDAVPVVRCGGCEYSLSYCGYLVCSLSARSRNPKANYIVNPDFFCAHGKRKEST